MKQPLVCAVLLTKDRPAMAARAVRAFRAQTYQNKRIIILDTGKFTEHSLLEVENGEVHGFGELNLSIGKLRNIANGLATKADILIHFDDDDVSHPNRIAEQVAHLQSSGADVAGYDEILFWRQLPTVDTANAHPVGCPCGHCDGKGSVVCTAMIDLGAAWLYKNKLAKAGSSFCYWRRVWESRPFPDLPRPERGGQGEDWEWAAGLNMERTSGICRQPCGGEPRLICSIHGGNTLRGYDDLKESANWKRVPEWDAYCRERMVL
jgi:glycosyltransferase involved in cell wall biosynthesis